jgi:2-phospho-L-lactate guanylyltransferase
MKTGIIIPVKELRESKARLASILSETEREELTMIMFSAVIENIRKSQLVDEILTVTPDDQVAELGKSLGSTIILEDYSRGVNIAVFKGNEYYTARRFNATLVLPADIPLIAKSDLDRIIELAVDNDVIITPSLDQDGTNALLQRPPAAIETFYDNDSFTNHVRESLEKRLKSFIFRAPSIMLDVDSPHDVLQVISNGPKSRTARFLKQRSQEGRVRDIRN